MRNLLLLYVDNKGLQKHILTTVTSAQNSGKVTFYMQILKIKYSMDSI